MGKLERKLTKRPDGTDLEPRKRKIRKKVPYGRHVRVGTGTMTRHVTKGRTNA